MTAPPDLLAELLDATGLTGRVYCARSVRPPWGLRIAPGGEARIHVVQHGAAALATDDGTSLDLGPGDLVLLPGGGGHVLADAPGRPVVSLEVWKARGRLSPDRAGTSRLLCGTFTAGDGPHPVLALMPELLVVRASDATRRPGLAATLDQLDREVASPDVGSSRVVSLLLNVLFVQVLRFWLDERPADRADWLGALRDPGIGRVLVRVHQAPERPWSVASMAAVAGMSRAVFARRFHVRVGQPPLSYVAQLRIEAATRLLRGSELSLAQIADSVGYSSEYAFNRAFRRATGTAPGRWRRSLAP